MTSAPELLKYRLIYTSQTSLKPGGLIFTCRLNVVASDKHPAHKGLAITLLPVNEPIKALHK